MPRLTITLSEDRHRALKEAAARQGKTIRQIIEESLDFYGLKTLASASQLVARVRQASSMDEEDATRLGSEETREERLR